jgi:ketosteroid isomerase-like protein
MTIKFTILAAATLCFTANLPVPAATQKDAAAIVRHKFQAFNQHDADKIQRIYAANAVLHSPDNPELGGSQPIADTYRHLFTLIPDAKDDVTQIDSVGPRVYAQFLLTGHWGGALDKPLKVRLIAVYTVRDGHIVLDDTYYDRKQ